MKKTRQRVENESTHKKKSVLVLGAGGMAGHVIATFLRELAIYDVTTVSASHRIDHDTFLIDVFEIDKLNAFLSENYFDIVVNAIGALIQSSEERKDRSVYLNAYLPHWLEEKYANNKTKIIHLSTDCVFSGKNPPYTEQSDPDGTLFYDRTKYLGELNNHKDLTFRMSIIGPDSQRNGLGLFNWFYSQKGSIDGFTEVIWNGVTSVTLAQAINEAIKQDLNGLYHLVPDESISKFDLLCIFQKVFERKDIFVQPTGGLKFDKTLINSRSDFLFSVPSYWEQVVAMKEWIDAHPVFYAHYLEQRRDA